MTDLDAAWDEDRGGPTDSRNLISFPTGGDFYKATKAALPWSECGAHDEGRHVVASVFIEKLVRKAPVQDPPTFNTDNFMTKCLDVERYLAPALGLLVEEGLLRQEDEDGDETFVHFADADELYETADALVVQLKDAREMLVRPECLEWLNGYTNNSAREADIEWFHGLTMDKVLRDGDLQAYVALGLAVGPRSLEAERSLPGSQFYAVVGAGSDGGQLAQAVRKYYFPGGQGNVTVDPSFLLDKVVSFFKDTAWPTPYEQSLPQWVDYAYELSHRAMWKTANRQEWMVVVTNRIQKAINGLTTLEVIFRDQLGDQATLARNYEALGDAVLRSTTGLPFWRIEDVEAALAKDYSEFVQSEREASQHTSDILIKLHERLKPVTEGRAAAHKQEEESEISGPKPSMLAKACSTQSYASLDLKYTPSMEAAKQTLEDKLEMLAVCLGAQTVLPKAVLFATKGVKMSNYIGGNGAEFLVLLHEQRHLMNLYIMRSLAYDEEAGEVPKHMRTLMYDDKEMDKVREFKWEKLDILNEIILRLRGAEAGTVYATHPQTKMYHDGDIIRLVQQAGSRLFTSIGYPTEVDNEEGWTFHAFMGQVARFQKYAAALSPEEQKTAHSTLDELMARAYKAAAANAKRIVYGASPADNRLRAWLTPDEAVVIELKDMLEGMKEHAQHRRQTAGIFAKDTPAAVLPGLMGPGKADKSKRQGDDKKPEQKTRERSKRAKSSPGRTKPPPATPSGKTRDASARGRNTAEGKHVYPYADGNYSIGSVYVKWIDQCKKFGWDPDKLCGPVVNSMVPSEVNCPFGHPAGCPKHKRPVVDNKPFDIKDHKDALIAAGITTVQKQLKDDNEAGRKPPGKKMENGHPVYAARHF